MRVPIRRWKGFWGARSRLGTALALAAFLLSFSPSLLPRPWLLQSAATGLSAACAYAVGALAGSLLGLVFAWLGITVRVDRSRMRRVQIVSLLAVTVVIVGAVWKGRQNRRLTAELVGLPAPTVTEDVLAAAGGLAIGAAIILLVVVLRVLLATSRWMLRLALPDWVARVAAVILVLVVIGWLSNEFLVRRTLDSVSRSAAALNASDSNRSAPTSWLRSGGPGSTQPWEDLGRQGQLFTSSGPGAEEISQITGDDALDPIRVYASLGDNLSLDEITDNIMAELDRTGAFHRRVLVLVNTTGRGWVDDFNASSVEYLSGGDSAIAAIQYSYLASPLAYLTMPDRPIEAARMFFDKVYQRWSALPPDQRPKLYVSGESLGAYGGASVFADASRMLDSVDGAVWIGTPSFTPMVKQLTARRLRGSPEVTPVIDQGRSIRFVTSPQDLTRDRYGREYPTWRRPRVVFLQHASDPIVWWDPSLLASEPDWIGERAGTDVNPALRWWPLVTFWQLTIDQAVANEPAAGHGHIYEDDMVAVWDAVLHSAPHSAAERSAIVTAIRAAHTDEWQVD